MIDPNRRQSALRRAFEYPKGPHVRKHGAGGYSDYEPYRDWLRDEFSFRCVICLHREAWWTRVGAFHIDHVAAQSRAPAKRLDYDNLLYLCARCNLVKGPRESPDACSLSLDRCLRVREDGKVAALDREGQRLIDVFCLNAKEGVQFRAKMMQMLKQLDDDGLKGWLGYPQDLPDLRKKRPPWNTRPEGVHNCFCALRERGQIPDLY